jgi:excinuclease ABC subunit C
MMEEVVRRRFGHDEDFGGPPDLLLVDGGKGQLSSAIAALRAAGKEGIPVVSLAKERVRGGEKVFRERLFVPGRKNPIVLPGNDPLLHLLMRVRDEAHRFAVTFHRQRRAKRNLGSDLDAIPNIGPRRRKALLTSFGSLAGVRRATREELVRVVGARTADAVLAHFASQR